jgi:cell division protein FtsL
MASVSDEPRHVDYESSKIARPQVNHETPRFTAIKKTLIVSYVAVVGSILVVVIIYMNWAILHWWR